MEVLKRLAIEDIKGRWKHIERKYLLEAQRLPNEWTEWNGRQKQDRLDQWRREHEGEVAMAAVEKHQWEQKEVQEGRKRHSGRESRWRRFVARAKESVVENGWSWYFRYTVAYWPTGYAERLAGGWPAFQQHWNEWNASPEFA